MGAFALIVLLLIGVVLYLSASNRLRHWPAARAEFLRALMTVTLVVLALVAAFTGRFSIVPITLFLAIPIVRTVLDPKRDHIPPDRQQKMTAEMTRDEALRILELDVEEATPAAVEVAYVRLMKLVHPDRGGTTYFAAKLNAARDFLTKNPPL